MFFLNMFHYPCTAHDICHMPYVFFVVFDFLLREESNRNLSGIRPHICIPSNNLMKRQPAHAVDTHIHTQKKQRPGLSAPRQCSAGAWDHFFPSHLTGPPRFDGFVGEYRGDAISTEIFRRWVGDGCEREEGRKRERKREQMGFR